MISTRKDGRRLLIVYRFKPFAIIGVPVTVVGIALAVFAVFQHHTVTLRCEPSGACTLERRAVVGTERVEIAQLREVEVAQELVLRGDPDVVMGPYVSREHVPSYERAAEQIRAYLKHPQALEVSVPVRTTVRYYGFAGVLFVVGVALLAVFGLGSRAKIDAGGKFWRWRSHTVRGSSDDITAVEVRGNRVMVKLRDGRELALLATLAGRKRNPPRPRPDLEEVARAVRAHLGL